MKLLNGKGRQHNLNIPEHRPRNLRRKRTWTSRTLGSKAAQGKDVCPLVFCVVLCGLV